MSRLWENLIALLSHLIRFFSLDNLIQTLVDPLVLISYPSAQLTELQFSFTFSIPIVSL